MVILCIMGMSGSGKSTIESALVGMGYNKSISYTTRKIRDKEVDGVDYHFVTEEQFKKLIKNKMVMEYAMYNGNYYGSPRPIGAINNVVVVEPKGYKQIKKIYGDQVIGVYIEADNEIRVGRSKNRLMTLNTEDTEEIEKRTVEDKKVFKDIENNVDYAISGDQDINVIVMQILKCVRTIKKERGLI